MIGANVIIEREQVRRDAVEAWVAAATEADLWRSIAGRLAAHVRAVNRTGDAAARGARLVRGDVYPAPGGWHAYRQATIDAGIDLGRIEAAVGERLDRPEDTINPATGSRRGVAP